MMRFLALLGFGAVAGWLAMDAATSPSSPSSTPTDAQSTWDLVTVPQLLRPLQALVPDLRLTSGLRSTEHNAAVGGSETSAHVRGLALDVKSASTDAGRLLLMAIDAGLPIDQGIAYATGRGGHLHLATVAPGGTLRRMYGIAPDGSTGYRWGLDQVRQLADTPNLS